MWHSKHFLSKFLGQLFSHTCRAGGTRLRGLSPRGPGSPRARRRLASLPRHRSSPAPVLHAAPGGRASAAQAGHLAGQQHLASVREVFWLRWSVTAGGWGWSAGVERAAMFSEAAARPCVQKAGARRSAGAVATLPWSPGCAWLPSPASRGSLRSRAETGLPWALWPDVILIPP